MGLVDSNTRIAQYVPEQIAMAHGWEIPATMSKERLITCGQEIAKELLSQGLIREHAFEVFQFLQQKNVEIVVATASSRELTQGIISYLASELLPNKAPPIHVVGQDHIFNADGTVHSAIRMRRDDKINFVNSLEDIDGVSVLLGAGDNLNHKGNDAFVRKKTTFGFEVTHGQDGWLDMLQALKEIEEMRINDGVPTGYSIIE